MTGVSKNVGRPRVLAEPKTALAKRLRIAFDTENTNEIKQKYFTDVSERTIRRYLEGETEPSLEVVAELAKRLGVSTDWLLTGRQAVNRIPLGDSPAAHVSQAYAQGAHDHGIITDPTADLTGNSTAAADLRTGLTPAQVAACRTLAEVVSELMAGQKRILEDPAFAERVLGRYATLAKELLPE